MDRQTIAYNGKQSRQEIIAPEGSHGLKGITDTSIWMQC